LPLATNGSPGLDHDEGNRWRVKRSLLTIFQVVITAVLVWWVFRDPAKREEIRATLALADPLWLLAGFLCYGAIEFLGTIRWQLLLRLQNIHLTFNRVFSLTLIGVFFNFFIPGGTGGDAVKMFFLMKETPGRRALGLLSIVVDRFIGLLGLILIAGTLIAFKWHWLTRSPAITHWVYIAIAVLGSALIVILGSFAITGFGLTHRLPARMPGRNKIAELALAYNLYGRSWQPAGAGLIISVVVHLGYFAVFYCAMRALAPGTVALPSAAEFFAIMPVIGTITALPISLGGIGWREMLFETFFLHLASASAGVAVAISAAGYLLTLAWGLIGGAVYLAYRPTDHASLETIRAETDAAEQRLAEVEIARETNPPGKLP
jgi:uncharacterized membrane protein YbhN (UPF0104 family)